MQPRVGFRCRACVVPAAAIQAAAPAAAVAAGGGALASLAASAGGAGAVRWLGVPDARDASVAGAPADEYEGGALVARVPSSAVSTVFVAQGQPASLATGGPVIAALARQGSGAAAAAQVLLLEVRGGDACAWACESGGGPALAPAPGRLRASSSAAALLQVVQGGSTDIPVKGGGGRASPAAGAPAAAAAAAALDAAAAAEDEPLPPLPPCPEGGQAPPLADRDPADFSGAVASLPADIGGRAPLRRLLAPAVLGPDVATAAATLGAVLLQALGRTHAGALQARY